MTLVGRARCLLAFEGRAEVRGGDVHDAVEDGRKVCAGGDLPRYPQVWITTRAAGRAFHELVGGAGSDGGRVGGGAAAVAAACGRAELHNVDRADPVLPP